MKKFWFCLPLCNGLWTSSVGISPVNDFHFLDRPCAFIRGFSPCSRSRLTVILDWYIHHYCHSVLGNVAWKYRYQSVYHTWNMMWTSGKRVYYEDWWAVSPCMEKHLVFPIITHTMQLEYQWTSDVDIITKYVLSALLHNNNIWTSSFLLMPVSHMKSQINDLIFS